MAKFYGEIGFGHSVEVKPGVFKDTITVRKHKGDIVRNTRNLNTSDNFANEIQNNNSISIVADAYANENYFAMRYIKWMGALWTVQSVEVQSPRLILRLGGVYNGPKG